MNTRQLLQIIMDCLLVQVNRCLSIKGAEDVLNKPHAFEITTVDSNYFFIADTDKVEQLLLSSTNELLSPHWQPCCTLQEKEDWINAVGRAIVRHSKRYASWLSWACWCR